MGRPPSTIDAQADSAADHGMMTLNLCKSPSAGFASGGNVGRGHHASRDESGISLRCRDESHTIRTAQVRQRRIALLWGLHDRVTTVWPQFAVLEARAVGSITKRRV